MVVRAPSGDGVDKLVPTTRCRKSSHRIKIRLTIIALCLFNYNRACRWCKTILSVLEPCNLISAMISMPTPSCTFL